MNSGDENIDKIEAISPHQEQVHSIVFSKEIGWQEIIYDLINSEQLDPWNIDIIVLTNSYLQKLQKYEEESYFISSKVLLAAALLLRIKSEILLNKYIKSIDEILFGSKDEKKKYISERMEIDDVPDLIPRSPIPRFRKVTMQELIESLNQAIVTENRRIKKEITNKNVFREVSISLPKRKYISQDKIKEIYELVFGHFEKNKNDLYVPFSVLIGGDREEKIFSFSSILHLENQKKIWIDQKEHFGELHIWMKDKYFENNPNPFADLMEKVTEEIIEEVSGEDSDNLEIID
ncbi:MAG: segregation/condensation protein A [Nanoarchaeota archaeon]